MIGIFTKRTNTELISLVEDAGARIGLGPKEYEVIELSREGVRARDHALEIAKMDACIVDIDVRGPFYYAMEVGSLGEGVEETLDMMSDRSPHPSRLDSKLLLVTKGRVDSHQVLERLGSHYSSLSLAAGIDDQLINALSSWIQTTLEKAQPKIFISYRSAKKEFARTLSVALKGHGALVWFDEWKILPGDSIPHAVNRGLAWCTHLVLVVDDTFFDSRWTEAEVDSMLFSHLSGRRRFRMHPNERPLIPLFLVDPAEAKMPPMLARIRGIDCREEAAENVANRLWNAVTTIGPR